MSRCDKDGDTPYWALIGVSIFLISAAFFSAWIISGYQAAERVRSQKYVEEAGSNPDHKLLESCRRFTTPDEILDCLSEQVRESREGERSEQDLYAQRNMATAAWATVGITSVLGILTFGVSIYAAVLLRDTLRANCEAVEVARKSISLQMRPFFVFEDAKVSFRVNEKSLEYDFSVLIVNGSSNVAFIERSISAFGLHTQDSVGSQGRSDKALPNVIGPNNKSPVRISGSIRVIEEGRAYSHDRRLGLIFVVKFQYTGIAGGIFEDEFWFYTHRFGILSRMTNIPIVQIPKPQEGNEYAFMITDYVD